MGLSFHYEFTALAGTSPGELESFLRDAEQLAKDLGFKPTMVLNAAFDTKPKRDFARRLGGSFTIHDEKLKGMTLSAEGQVRDHDPVSGFCRLVPEHGVVLVLTDERECETCFGFFKFPKEILDSHGKGIAPTGFEGTWSFRDFIDSPDPRYRKIVEQFEVAGYAKSVKDEFR